VFRGADHHAEICDVCFSLSIGNGADMIEFTAFAFTAPVVIADEALHDVLVVREIEFHKGVEFVLINDGKHALTGIAVGYFDDGLSAHFFDDGGDFLFSDIPVCLRGIDFQPVVFYVFIKELVSFSGNHFISTTGDTGNNGVENTGFGR